MENKEKDKEKDKEKESMFAIVFNHLLNFNNRKYQILTKTFGSLEKAFYAPRNQLLLAGIKEKTIRDFYEKKKKFSLKQVLADLSRENIKVCFIEDESYPKLLKNIYNPPPLFYYQGNLDINWDLSLSVVGSRDFSFYGNKVIKDFIPILTNSKISIISGLAFGIDSLAHQETIKNGGQTIAVLGSGIDKKSIYPRDNYGLAKEIIKNNGLIISEFSPQTPGFPYNFPTRNRIIAGLSKYTLIVEAGKKSGSLITAKYALEEGREVLSVVGDIYSHTSLGTNELAKEGAHVITKVEDILALFGNLPIIKDNPTQKYQAENELEKKILKILEQNKMNIDEICLTLEDDVSKITKTLSILEIKGAIKDSGGKNYRSN
ncbi:DNA-protecting protein DprA [Candidatus Falkowbacteria bacterium HGW-Falkowbacteria-1]|uniref:DNA-protecting protein DprA n=1 Tax=Candidatus Falkowbacteria bacterium HGW-Falkowbacteria-1 TaxID=2013768 RepID=A0A2N2EAA1_9BACT|nr:MAG: DNA-protecting protein DprA [Candidatus Falkowbacteria bacterium HGW-Falkowbacteria-1]